MHKHVRQLRVCCTHDCVPHPDIPLCKTFPNLSDAHTCLRKLTNLFRQENNICALETSYLDPGAYLNYTVLLHPPAEHARLQLSDVHPQPDSSLRDSLCTTG